MRLWLLRLRALCEALGWLVRALLDRAAEIVAPRQCAGCDEPLVDRSVFCPACACSVEPWAGGWSRLAEPREGGDESVRLLAFGRYGGALADAIRRLKYQDRPDLARPLGELLRRASAALPRPVDVVVPVPLHFSRLAVRGYNQSALLARIVARQLGVGLAPRALGRSRPSPPQVTLSGDERRRSLRGAFVARQARRLRGHAVLLVDDVATTGTTLIECARAALDAGASSVDAIVLARAEAGSGSPNDAFDAATSQGGSSRQSFAWSSGAPSTP